MHSVFGGVAVPSDVDFETKARKVAVDEGKSFGQGVTGRKGEGTIINVEELVYLVGGEVAGGEHCWGVAAHMSLVEFGSWCVCYRQDFYVRSFPC